MRVGLRFWACLCLSQLPYIPIQTLFVLTNAYLFPSTPNMWESCVKRIMRTWDTWNTKQWLCIQEEWGRCMGTSFSSVYKHIFFPVRYWALKWWLNPLFWDCYSSLSSHNWYLLAQLVLDSGGLVHEAALEGLFLRFFPKRATGSSSRASISFSLMSESVKQTGDSPQLTAFLWSPREQWICKSAFPEETEVISSSKRRWKKQCIIPQPQPASLGGWGPREQVDFNYSEGGLDKG